MISEIMAIKNKEVNKIMVPKNEIVQFAYYHRLGEVINIYQQSHYLRYPVYYNDTDHIVGVLYIKDIIPFWHEYHDYPVVEFVRFPYFIYQNRPALDVLLELQKLRLSLGIVIDEFGGVTGIITVEDLLEEIVGDIDDEFDKERKPLIEQISDHEYILDTRMALDDFGKQFNVAIDENDVTTVSGLILKHADRIPKVGEEVKYKNLKFTILEGTRRKLSKVRVKKT